MTEQTPDPVEPRSLPKSLSAPGTGPNDLTPPEWRRTATIVWSLIGLVFVGGLVVMALTWRDIRLPGLPEGPDLSFDMPEFRLPEIDSPIEVGGDRTGPPPRDMVENGGPEARPVGEIDKPGGTDVPPADQAGELRGGNTSAN